MADSIIGAVPGYIPRADKELFFPGNGQIETCFRNLFRETSIRDFPFNNRVILGIPLNQAAFKDLDTILAIA